MWTEVTIDGAVASQSRQTYVPALNLVVAIEAQEAGNIYECTLVRHIPAPAAGSNT